MKRCLALASLVLALAACEEAPDEKRAIQSAQARIAKQELAAAAVELKTLLASQPESAKGRLLLGRVLLASVDAKAAVIELNKARELGVADEDVVPDLARAMLASGEAAALLAQFGDLKLGKPEASADLLTSLAAAQAGQGSPDAARALAERALQAQPGYPAALVVLARLHAATGDRAGAIARLDEVLAAQPGHEVAGLLKADLLMASGSDKPAALALMREVRERNPKSVPAHAAVVNALVLADTLAEARTEFKTLEQLAPRHPETLFLGAQFMLADGQHKAAAEQLELLLSKAPDNLRALTLAGAARLANQQPALAEAHLTRALKSAPGMLLPRQLLARAYLSTGQAAKALEALQPALGAQADRETLTIAGEAFLQAGDPARSEAAFRQALKTAPVDPALQTAVATAQLARGESGPALAQLESIARTDPGVGADQTLVNARIRAGDTQGALKALDSLERKLPALAYPLGLRGRVLAGAGDAAGAKASFDKALAKDPKYLPAAIGLAEFDIAAGRIDEARQRIQAVIKADPSNVHPRLALAELVGRTGGNESSITAALREAVKADAAQPAGHVALVNRLVLAGNGAAALLAAQEASSALPNDPQVADALGRAQLAAGDARSAVATFKKLSAQQGGTAMPLVRLAEAQAQMGDGEAAVASLRQATRLEPELALAQRRLALALVASQRAKEAVDVARALQQKQPKSSEGHAIEAEVHVASGDPAAAALAWREALRRDPANSDVAVRLHRSLLAAGKAADASRLADEWLRSQPRDTLLQTHLGDMAVAAKEWPSAEAHFRAVLAKEPRHVLAMNNLAWVLGAQRKPGATAMAERALALMPDRAALLDTLAYTLAAENQLERALTTQRKAVQLEPGTPELRLHLAQLLAKSGNKGDALKELQPLATLGPAFAGQAEVATLMKSLQ